MHGHERIQKNVPGGPKEIYVSNGGPRAIVGNSTT